MDSRQQKIEEGIAARDLLANETFASTINSLAATLTGELLGTAPQEKDRREALYHQHVALQTLIGILQARANTADALLREEEFPDEDDY